jgi:hypothetical protein
MDLFESSIRPFVHSSVSGDKSPFADHRRLGAWAGFDNSQGSDLPMVVRRGRGDQLGEHVLQLFAPERLGQHHLCDDIRQARRERTGDHRHAAGTSGSHRFQPTAEHLEAGLVGTCGEEHVPTQAFQHPTEHRPDLAVVVEHEGDPLPLVERRVRVP